MRSARTGRGKAPAIALAVLCLLGPVLGYAHMLLVAHARCPEHGELLHLNAAVASRTVAPSQAPSSHGSIGSAEDLLPESHDHDLCLVASARKADVALSTAGPVATVGVAGAHDGVDRRPAASPPVPLYILAPKNSPPA